MAGQSPITQFENYPRTSPDPASEVVPDVNAAPLSAQLPSSVPGPVDPQKRGWSLSRASVSRRTALGWLVGIPVVAVIGIEVFARRSVTTVSDNSDHFQAAVYAAAPDGWDLNGDSRGWAIQRGGNEVRAVVLEDQAGENATIMSEALAALQPPLKADPTTATERTVAGSAAIEVRNSGEVRGKKARQVVDVFVDPGTGRALAITQLLRVDPGSKRAEEAKEFVSSLVGGWPW